MHTVQSLSSASRSVASRTPARNLLSYRAAMLAVLVAAAACTPAAAPSTAPTPAVRPAPSGNARIAPPPAVSLEESPINWQLRDLATEGIAGVGSERALNELLAGRTPGRTVVVAVIDGGVDTSHVDVRPVLWSNPREKPGRTDSDNNGYAGDMRGWNFIGGADGQNVHHDTFELTREYVACRQSASARTPEVRAARCSTIAEAYLEKREEVTQTLAQIENLGRMLDGAVSVLKTAVSGAVTTASVRAVQPNSPQVSQAKQMFLQLAENDLTPEVLAEAREAYGSQAKYGLDTLYDPRNLVGDRYSDLAERSYGNADIAGPDAKHGTHVAGIIAGVRGNSIGLEGITNGVQIMGVRAVPDGDERDKDVANAIRYAADNGANIINMSFGKSYSPNKALVDDAVRYAESKGVLMIHAAGNDGKNIDEASNFPNATFEDGARAQLWIEVGASSWKGGNAIAASFSNYGRNSVDLFAPGVGIYSSVPGNEFERQDGTSMAAPVVSGVAALIMAYYPELSARDVKEILLATVTKLSDVRVMLPGAESPTMVPFGSLSKTGGIINAYEAVKMAEARRKASQP